MKLDTLFEKITSKINIIILRHRHSLENGSIVYTCNILQKITVFNKIFIVAIFNHCILTQTRKVTLTAVRSKLMACSEER